MSYARMMPELLKHVTSIRSQHQRVFNPASLLLKRELDLSRVFAWMLDPLGTHKAGAQFLATFLTRCDISIPKTIQQARVRLEVPRYVRGELVGRADIEVSHSQFVLLIENKPTAPFGHNQLERYMQSLPMGTGREGKVVALVGSGWEQQDITEIEASGPRVLKLGGDVSDWVSICCTFSDEAPVKHFLESLNSDLEDRYSGRNSKVMKEIAQLIITSPETMAAAVAIIEGREALIDAMNARFRQFVEDRAHAAGLGGVRPILHEGPLFSGNKWGALRLDIGDERLDFAISADATYFREVVSGVALRKKTSGSPKIYANEVTKLRASLGNGDCERPDDWWLWWEHIGALDAGGRHTDGSPELWAWATDATDEGLAACFVRKACEAKIALTNLPA